MSCSLCRHGDVCSMTSARWPRNGTRPVRLVLNRRRNMTFLPIVGRELRVAARRGQTYWSRFQAAVGALVPTGFLVVDPLWQSSATRMGQAIFRHMAFLAFLWLMIAGARLTGDCLSSEKREGTLGFLFLTDLRAYDIVLGKLTATSVNMLYGLLALIPVMALPTLLGGV